MSPARKTKTPTTTDGKIKAMLRGELKEPQLAEIAAHFFSLAGGPRQVAKMLYDTYSAPGCTPIVRHRIMNMILQATRFANLQAPPARDLGLATEEDLAREVEELLAGLGGEPSGQESSAGACDGPVAATESSGQPE